MRLTPAQIDIIKSTAQAVLGESVRLMIVFGSCANGTPRPDSDLDIAMAMDQHLTVQQHIDTIGAPCHGRRRLHALPSPHPPRKKAGMDRQVIDQKLESLRSCLSRIESKIPFDADQLAGGFDLQDIVSLNLTRAVQQAVDFGAHIASGQNQPGPSTMGETVDQQASMGVLSLDLAAQLKKSVGFRNIAVHNYSSINWLVVHAIVLNHLQDFKHFETAVTQWQAN